MKIIESMQKLIENKLNKSKDKDDSYKNKVITTSITENINYVKKYLGESFDLLIRNFPLDSQNNQEIAIIFMNGLCDHDYVNETLVEYIITNHRNIVKKENFTFYTKDFFKNNILTFTEVTEDNTFEQLFNSLLGGDTIIFVDKLDSYFIVATRKYQDRQVSTPSTDASIKGPQNSFNENMVTNISLIRRIIKSPNLWVKKITVGKKTNTDISVVYLDGIAKEEVVNEVMKRLDKIEIDSIIDSSNISYAIKDKNFCLFPLTYDNERPDVIAGNLLEGRVAIIVDGSPFALIVPVVFNQFFQYIEDYYQKSYMGSFYRLLRISAFYIALLFPALYIALVNMHPELLPFELMVRIAAQREGLPFSSTLEALMMTLIFDLIREAGVRMPRAGGNAVTIVGALVLGDAAVKAGIVSPIMIIVVSLTAITQLAIPIYLVQLQTTILKYFFILLAAFMGLYGLAIGTLLMYLHLCSVRSFGVSYYTPFAPLNIKGLKDTLLRFPLKKFFKSNKNFNDKYPN